MTTEINGMKIYKDGNYDVEITDIYEESDQLIVKTKCPFGEDSFCFSQKSTYIDKFGIPKWKTELKQTLERKYGVIQPDGKTNKAPKKIIDSEKGKCKLADLNKK